MSRLAAIAGGPPSTLGVTARIRRSRQSAPASIAPINSSIASTARKPHGSRAASPATGAPTRSRRTIASHAPLVRVPQLRRLRLEWAARTVGQRLQRPVQQPARALDAASCGSGIGQRDQSRNAMARASRKPAPKASKIAAWNAAREHAAINRTARGLK